MNFLEISEINTARVLEAFRRHRVSDSHFAASSGYGYNDPGREVLDAVFADIFQTESALVRTAFQSGTHAIACALKAAAPNGGYWSLTGEPYDTLQSIMPYRVVSPNELERELSNGKPAAFFIQRSRGYSARKALSVSDVDALIGKVRKLSDAPIVVDNCYCEFCEVSEPSLADLIAGSLIKNPGGGLAPTGGYIAGRRDLTEKAAIALNFVGSDMGANPFGSRLLFQGLITAPHVVCQALQTAKFAAEELQKLGFSVDPLPSGERFDIIQTVNFGTPEPLIAFCRGIQAASPIDSHLTPEPWDMPGYQHKVIMAAGTFIQGASIELSCDAPIREPYTAYLQGGLTFELGKLCIEKAIESLRKLI